MSVPVYIGRNSPGQIRPRNSNFENHTATPVGSAAVNTWIMGASAGSLTNDQYGWAIRSGTAGFYYDPSTSKWGGSALACGMNTTTSNPSFSNWLGSNIAKYGIPCKPNTTYTGVGIFKTSYITGTLGDGIGAYTYFEERDLNGILLATHQTQFVTGNVPFNYYYSDPFVTLPNTRYFTMGGGIIGLNGINDLKMFGWWSGIWLIGPVPTRIPATARIAASSRNAVGF